jgi:ERCC4-type nuclease
MPDFTEIIADDRESTSGIFEHLTSFSDVRLHIERLLTGDYIVDNTMIFERKAAADFAESLVDTRLFSQARRPKRSATSLESGEPDFSGRTLHFD